MILLSCSNCCFNGLQYGAIGLTVGYCVEHERILRRADETTCGRHFRKDLPFVAADGFNQRHRQHFRDNAVYQIRTQRNVMKDPVYVETDRSQLAEDSTGEVVTEYGFQGTKISSLASLRKLIDARADLAYFSLSRSYVRRCMAKGGKWTSGLHLLWWTKERLKWKPDLSMQDFRLQTNASMARQNELAVWSLLMLRIMFIADVGEHAKSTKSDVRVLANLAEEAAEAASTDLSKLWRWIQTRARPQLEDVLPEKKYRKLLAQIESSGDEE